VTATGSEKTIVTFSECTSAGEKCTGGKGAKAGQIKTFELTGTLGIVTDSPGDADVVGEDLVVRDGPGDESSDQPFELRGVDRFGVVQVILRDRYAGPHTPATASGKAWTAATFRNSTSNLFAISQPGMMQAGIRNLPGAVIVGGGLVVESGGSLVGAIGVLLYLDPGLALLTSQVALTPALTKRSATRLPNANASGIDSSSTVFTEVTTRSRRWTTTTSASNALARSATTGTV